MPVDLANERQQQCVALCLEAQEGKTYVLGATQDDNECVYEIYFCS